MKLRIKRDQADVKGILGGHKGVRFKLHARAEISPEEKDLIERYKVWDYILGEYSFKDLTLPVRIRELVNGFSHETESIGMLLGLEQALKENCGQLKTVLEVMRSFGGEETVEI